MSTTNRRHFFWRLLACAVAIFFCCESAAVAAPEPIRVGDIFSYTKAPLFAGPWRKGWELCAAEANARGGVLGRPVEVISRDDKGSPEEAVRMAQELIARDKVSVLMGSFFSHVALAVSEVAKRERIPYMAFGYTDKLIWENGHRYAFRVRPTSDTQGAALAAVVARTGVRRWATVAANYEAGHAAVEAFRKYLPQNLSGVEFVGEQWPPLGKFDAGPVLQAVTRMRADGICLLVIGSDEMTLAREARMRRVFEGKTVASFLTGFPEMLRMYPPGDFPVGWISPVYPAEQISGASHDKFRNAYRARYNDEPMLNSLCGYSALQALLAGIEKAGSTDAEKIVEALEGLRFETPLGPALMRKADHQSTMGIHVGKTALTADGKPTVVDVEYYPGEKFLPSEEEAAKRRPKN